MHRRSFLVSPEATALAAPAGRKLNVVFILAEDPAEAKDLCPARPDIATGLKKKLDAWELDVRAPRLKDFA